MCRRSCSSRQARFWLRSSGQRLPQPSYRHGDSRESRRSASRWHPRSRQCPRCRSGNQGPSASTVTDCRHDRTRLETDPASHGISRVYFGVPGLEDDPAQLVAGRKPAIDRSGPLTAPDPAPAAWKGRYRLSSEVPEAGRPLPLPAQAGASARLPKSRIFASDPGRFALVQTVPTDSDNAVKGPENKSTRNCHGQSTTAGDDTQHLNYIPSAEFRLISMHLWETGSFVSINGHYIDEIGARRRTARIGRAKVCDDR